MPRRGFKSQSRHALVLAHCRKGQSAEPCRSFKTAADPDKTDKVSFIQVSDTQNAYYNEHKRNEAAYGADTLLQALRHFPNTDFVLHTGDFVETGSIEDEWFDLFKRSAPILTQTTVAPVAGNHESIRFRTACGALERLSGTSTSMMRFQAERL